MEKSIVTVDTMIIKDDMKYNGETVLTYQIEYPQFKSSFYHLSLLMINHFYKSKALEYQQYCRTELYKMAVEQYQYDIEHNYPIRVFEALKVYKLTYNMACVISLYFDKYEYTGGAHGNTVRTSQTWNLQKCSIIKLRELYRCLDYKKYFINQIKEQIEKDSSLYFEDYEKLIKETFNENSFYCTPQGIIIYYQQYDIAPYSSGIREFLIPYSNCVVDPIKKCF